MIRYLLFCILIGLWSCNSENKTKEIVTPSIEKQTLVEPISSDSLLKMCPTQILDFQKVKEESDKTGTMGYRVSSVFSTYKNEQNPKSEIRLYITDTGGSKQILGAGAWANLDYSKPNEFTMNWKNNKLYFRHKPKNLKTDVQILNQNRFIWQLKINGLDSADVFRALELLPL